MINPNSCILSPNPPLLGGSMECTTSACISASVAMCAAVRLQLQATIATIAASAGRARGARRAMVLVQQRLPVRRADGDHDVSLWRFWVDHVADGALVAALLTCGVPWTPKLAPRKANRSFRSGSKRLPMSR